MNYIIEWEIVIDEESPEKAVPEAMGYITNPQTTNIFVVKDIYGKVTLLFVRLDSNGHFEAELA